MAKLLARALIFGLVLALFSAKPTNLTFAATQEQINDYTVEIKIDSDGTVDVVETIKYYFPTQKHGIYRNIPTIKTNKDNKKYELDISVRRVDFTVNDITKKANYEILYENNDLKIKIGDADKYVVGDVEYRISYSVKGALTYFSDHDELYWNATGSGWEVPIKKANVNINLHTLGNVKTKLNGQCYTGKTGSVSQSCAVSTDKQNNAVFFTANLEPYNGVTIVVGFPKGLVSVLEAKPYVPFEETLLAKILWGSFLFVLLVGAFLWYIVLPFFEAHRAYKAKKMEQNVRVVSAWFSPPKDKNQNEMSAAETGFIIDKKVDHRDVSATLIYLAQKGYLKIKQTEKDFELERTQKPSDSQELDIEETYLLDKIFKSKNSIKIKELSKSENIGKVILEFNNRLTKRMYRDGYFEEEIESFNTKNVSLLIFSAVSVNLFLFIIQLFRLNGALRSKKGIESFGQALSLRNFLTSQSDFLNFQADKQALFEKLLPYATAFGVERIWAERFKDLNIQNPNWYEGTNTTNFTNGIVQISNKFSAGAVGATASYKATLTTSTTGHSSGFSGGSSGGGGGGGGGGSW